MKLEEIVTKLEQIEQQAALTISEYPHGLTVERQRLIVGLARQLRMHVRDQLRQGGRAHESRSEERTLDESSHLRPVPNLHSASNLE